MSYKEDIKKNYSKFQFSADFESISRTLNMEIQGADEVVQKECTKTSTKKNYRTNYDSFVPFSMCFY